MHDQIKTPLLLVDGHNLLHRVFHVPSFQAFRSPDGLAVGAAYGMLQTLLRLCRAHPDYMMVVVWDGGRSERRLELLPDYKDRPMADQPQGDPAFVPVYRLPDIVEQLLNDMGVHSVNALAEADDVIAFLDRRCPESIIYSNDKDFWQLIRPGHRVLKSMGGAEIMMDEDNFGAVSKTGLTPREYRFHLAVCGDSTDNIPGVPQIGKKTSIKLIKAFEKGGWVTECKPDEVFDPEAAYEAFEPIKQFIYEVRTAKMKNTWRWAKLTAHWDAFIRSISLIDLWRDDLLTPDQQELAMGQLAIEPDFCRDALEARLERWAFNFDIDDIEALMTERLSTPEFGSP